MAKNKGFEEGVETRRDGYLILVGVRIFLWLFNSEFNWMFRKLNGSLEWDDFIKRELIGRLVCGGSAPEEEEWQLWSSCSTCTQCGECIAKGDSIAWVGTSYVKILGAPPSFWGT